MTAKVYKFPEIKETFGLKILLYNEVEIDIALLSVNNFSTYPHKIFEKDLSNIDPKFVIEGLHKANSSKYITLSAKKTIEKILNNVERIRL